MRGGDKIVFFGVGFGWGVCGGGGGGGGVSF